MTEKSAVLKKLSENAGMCAICVTVWQEFVHGYELMPEGKKATIPSFPTTALPPRFAASFGHGASRTERMPPPRFDSQIAATAIANGMGLITHNTEDFAALQEVSLLKVEDWWE